MKITVIGRGNIGGGSPSCGGPLATKSLRWAATAVTRPTLMSSWWLFRARRSPTPSAVSPASAERDFASLFDEIANQRVRHTSFFAADDEARDVTERLVSDAGYEPAFVGGLDKAWALEELGWLPSSAKGGAPVFYRFAGAGEL